ncbi:MAG: hypothetical protein HQL76_00080 [Magnetococcales bacterium]|nr:hypothetical protein [Magnetococcales bacterium]
MNFRDFVVIISVPTTDDLAELATGYPVAPNLILTARHVLEPEDRDRDKSVKAKWWGYKPEEKDDQGWLEAEIVWCGKDDLDAALLRLPERSWTPKEYLFLSSERPREGTEWASEGFPHVARREDCPKSASFHGKVYSMMDSKPYFEISEDANPVREEGWKGVSGMAVVVQDKLIGIVQSIPSGFDGKRLHAVPSWKMLEDPDFRKAIRYDDKQNRLDEYRALLEKEIQKNVDYFAPVAQEFGKGAEWGRASSKEEKGRLLAECMLRISLPDMLESLYTSWKEADDVSKQNVLYDVVRLLLPALYDNRIVEDIKIDKDLANPLFVELPAFHETVAEIIMAGVDVRSAQFRDGGSEDELPKGAFSLPDVPDSGIDVKSEAENLRKHLDAKFSPDFQNAVNNYLIKRFYKQPRGARERTLDEKKKLAATNIKNRRKRTPTFYLIFFMPDDPRACSKIREFMESIATDYHIACLAMKDNVDLELSEKELLGPLPFMVSPKPKRKKRNNNS